MTDATALYPLRFDPIFKYRLWGGRRLEGLLSAPLPGDGPVGEAWILSDRDDDPSRVADGPLAGRTISELIANLPATMMGRFATQFARFPLLLKFLDAREMLSVQVHPTDDQPELLPPGEVGKTEAWIVLQSDVGSEIFAGLEPGAGPAELRHLTGDTARKYLASFHPEPGDGLFIPAGTVHALGGGVVVFEVQENSDVTFRLYDWDRVDVATGKPRDLHADQAIRCVDFEQGPVRPVRPVQEEGRERMFDCTHFVLWRIDGDRPASVGAAGEPRLLVCAGGQGDLDWNGARYPVHTGDVYLVPSEVGRVTFAPRARATVFEIALPDAT